MIVDTKTGRIAYHAIRLHDRGPATFVQYGFDGKPLYEKPLDQTKPQDYYNENT